MRYTSFDYGDRANYIRHIAKEYPSIHIEALGVIQRVRKVMEVNSLKSLKAEYLKNHTLDYWVFSALALKHIYPDVYDADDIIVRLEDFNKPVADVLGQKESNMSKYINEARVRLKKLNGFKDEVNEIYDILNIMPVSPELNTGQINMFQ